MTYVVMDACVKCKLMDCVEVCPVDSFFNAFGDVVTPITLDSTVRPGVVALSHGYGQVQSPGTRVAQATPGVNTNRLMPTGPGSFEPLSNMSHMTGVPAEVEKVHDGERPSRAMASERRGIETERA